MNNLNIEDLPDIIWTANHAGNLTSLTRRWVEFTGLPLTSSMGMEWIAALHPEDGNEALLRWKDAIQTGVAFSLSCRLRRQDNVYRWMALHGRPVSSAEPARWCGAFTDIDNIDDHQRAEAPLTAEVERLRIATRATSDLSFEWDIEHQTLTMIHGSLETFLQIPGTEKCQQIEDFLAFIHPEDRPLRENVLVLLKHTDRPYLTLEYRMVRNNGEVTIVEERIAPIKDATGNIHRTISAFTEVTARRLIEEQRRLFLSRVRCLIWSSVVRKRDEQESLIWYTQFADDNAAREFMGFPDQLDQPLPHLWYNARLLEDRLRCDRTVNEAMRTGQDYEQEFRVLAADGTVRWMQEWVRMQVLLPERRWLLTGVCIDVTDQKRGIAEQTRTLEENTRLIRAQAESAELQRTFLRDVLYSVTEGRLRLCDTEGDLPQQIALRSQSIRLQPSTLNEARQLVRSIGIEAGLPSDRYSDLISAFGECAMNAVQHGGGSGIAQIFATHGKVQIWVQDSGHGISVSDLPKATLLKGHSGASSFGHGFYIMLRTVDTIWLLTGKGGTTVVMEQSAIAPQTEWGWLIPSAPTSTADRDHLKK